MRSLPVLAILLLLPFFAQAQTPNTVTAIPGKGLYVPPATSNTPGTSIPGAQLESRGSSTKNIDNFCQVCSCCAHTDADRLVSSLKKSGQQGLASDSDALKNAMDIDLSKMPR